MINRVVLVGRLTQDPSLRKTQSGISVVSFTVACNRRFSGGNGQDRQADFINCVAWRQSADFMAQYCHKGALVGVEGRIQTRNYDDATGRRVYVTEVVCDNVQILESKAASQNRAAGNAQASNNGFAQNNPSGDLPAEDSFDDFGAGPSLDISSDDLPF